MRKKIFCENERSCTITGKITNSQLLTVVLFFSIIFGVGIHNSFAAEYERWVVGNVVDIDERPTAKSAKTNAKNGADYKLHNECARGGGLLTKDVNYVVGEYITPKTKGYYRYRVVAKGVCKKRK